MCLLGIAFRSLPDCPVAILANREEVYSRPTGGPAVHPPHGGIPHWLGGTDLRAGGTWLGVSAHGLIAAVTNRPKTGVPPEPRSRGMLCRSLLACHSVDAAAEAALRQLRTMPFSGCNLLLATREAAMVIESGDELRVSSLSAGLHVMTNGDLNDPRDRRIARVRSELEALAPANASAWLAAAQRISGLSSDGELPAISLEFADRGTVSSTLLTLAQPAAESKYLYAAGPPSRIPFEDHSASLQRVLDASKNAPPHRIHLRGPWRYAPLSFIAPALSRAVVESPAGLDPGTAQLPAAWRPLVGDFRGTVRFSRRFHRPNNLELQERVFVVLEGVAAPGRVRLNGHNVGAIGALPPRDFRCDVTELLNGNDELTLDLTFAPENRDELEPIWRTAALEIMTRV